MYEALILLEHSLNPTMEEYVNHVESYYSQPDVEKPKISIDGQAVEVSFEGIQFVVRKNCNSSVLAGSQELAAFAASEVREEVSKSKCRLELSSSSDFDMIYFNDYLFLVNAAEKLGKVWTFSPAEGEFM